MSAAAPRGLGSVLDRLLPPPVDEQGRPLPPLKALKAAVQRDLEALLNARRPWASVPKPFAALNDSMLGYGLPDFAAGAFNAAARREALCREIAQAIARFEPRLEQVVVRLRDRPDTMEPVLRLKIEAVLRVAGTDEPVGFETHLDTTTTDLVVESESRV